MTYELYDCNRRPIFPGDILKIFHFVGARRKKHYMYKFVLKVIERDEGRVPLMKISHLNLNIDEGYYELMDFRVLPHAEIVQGYEPNGLSFEFRAKKKEEIVYASRFK